MNQPPQKLDSSHAIATAYRDFIFRSRLEAKWAVFFDLCGWPWSYEPLDFNGWIPDFAIGEWPTLVEVKPFFREDEWTDAKKKIIDSGCTQPVILLGADPTWIATHNCQDGFAPVFGWLYDIFDDDGKHWETEDLHFGLTEGNERPGLCPLEGAWRNWIWKAPADHHHPNKWSRVWLDETKMETELVRRWARASNASQWMKYEQPERNR